jgi:cysteinyl-tRNA synthetase
MSTRYLGEEQDIHTGGVDNIFPHHEGEIAQSEAAFGKPYVRHWVHGQHLLADGVKMAKSAGNSFILADIESQGIDPLAFRYLCLTARYRTRLNFTFTALKAAQRALLRLRDRVWEWGRTPAGTHDDGAAVAEWRDRFFDRVNDNLDMPGAVALVWNLARSGEPPQVKRSAVLEFDKVLGLGLADVVESYRVPDDVRAALERRASLRREESYSKADEIRERVESMGYVVQDTPDGACVRPKTPWERRQEVWSTVSSSAEVRSLIDEDSQNGMTVGIVACNYIEDVKRCVGAVRKWLGNRSAELLIVDNGSTDGTGEWLESQAASDESVRVIHTDHVLGEAMAKNVVLKQSIGETVVLLDTSVEVVGDLYDGIEKMLEDDTVGVVGPFGLRTSDLHHFHEGEGEAGDMDAMQAYCFAFRRVRLRRAGLMREGFRFYRNLDLDYSFQFKDAGYRIVADPTLPVRLHEHRVWEMLAEGEREEMSRKNYRRFLARWGDHPELLVSERRK